MLERRELTPREASLWSLVDAKHERDETRRQAHVTQAAAVLTPDEIYLGSSGHRAVRVL